MLPNPGEIVEYDFELFDWNQCIDCFQKSIDVSGDFGVKPLFDGQKIPSFSVHNANIIPQVQKVKDFILRNRRQKTCSSHMFVSLTNESHAWGLHSDKIDVYVWQVYGTTKWEVEYYDLKHDLSPNQMLYIPAGTMHRAIPVEPRIALSFGISEVDE